MSVLNKEIALFDAWDSTLTCPSRALIYEHESKHITTKGNIPFFILPITFLFMMRLFYPFVYN